MVDEARRALFRGSGQSQPHLKPMQLRSLCQQVLWRALRVHDASPRRHPVHRSGRDGPVESQAVLVPDDPLEEVRDGGEADVGVRSHRNAPAGREDGRPHVVEEDERADALALCGRQDAPYLEVAEILGPRADDQLDRSLVALAPRLAARLNAHAARLSCCRMDMTRKVEPACSGCDSRRNRRIAGSRSDHPGERVDRGWSL